MMKITLKSKFSYHFGGILFMLFFLGGCTSMRTPPVSQQIYADEHQRQTQLAQLNHWQASGKLIFKSPQKKFSASLNWFQQAQKSDIRLTTFLGISIMKMVNDGHRSTLHTDGKTFASDSPEQLLYETTGITLPVNELPDWMKGASGEYRHHTTEFDQMHRITQIKLLDAANQPWQIDYLDYQPVAEHQLPKKIRLSGGDIVATIKISQWELNPSD